MVERLTLLLRVLEVLNSNFLSDVVCSGLGINRFTQALPEDKSTEFYNTTLLVPFT